MPETDLAPLFALRQVDDGLLVFERAGLTPPESYHPAHHRGRPLQPGYWMNVHAWLDEDSRHVWVGHDCTDGRLVTMLPWPLWQVADAGRVEPSFVCSGCGVHTFAQIDRAPSGTEEDPR